MDERDSFVPVLQENLEAVRQRVIRAATRVGRNPEDVCIVGVTKTKPADMIRVGASLGITDIGENYAQECAGKHDLLYDLPLRWHFIGSLQRNKVKLVLPFVFMIHSVDSVRLGAEISRQAELLGRRVDILLQVNVSDEASKHGVQPIEAADIAKELIVLPGVALCGLMTLAADAEDPETVRPMFRRLREVRDELQEQTGVPLPELSMGMSGDFEVAIEEGATMVRVGSGIFGIRTSVQ